jgi:hypothetical protein
MSCTGQCVPVVSSWVRQFILTSNCNLAVWFRNGFCCVYPATTQAWFKQAIAAPRPGHFIHQYLYKKMAYRPIRPPCPPAGGGVIVPCCLAGLPTTIHATFSGGSGLCACLNGMVAALTWNGSTWSGTVAACVPNFAVDIRCAGSNVTALILILSTGGSTPAAVGSTCSPLALTFNGVNVGGCTGALTVQVTA